MDYSKPFPVKIIRDCRQGTDSANGLSGICLGEYRYPDTAKKMPDDKYSISPRERINYNPLFLLDNGSYIWGMECWWTFAQDARTQEELQEQVERNIEGIRKTLERVVKD